MNFFKIFLIAILSISATTYVYSQDGEETELNDTEFFKKEKFDWSKFSVGGNLGASFGNNYSFVELSPLFSYRPVKVYQFGVGPTYTWVKNKIIANPGVLNTHVYGLQAYNRFYIYKDLFAQIDGLGVSVSDRLRIENVPFFDDTLVTSNFITGNIFAGGGYNFRLGGNSFLSMAVRVNLIENASFPTRRPYFNIGVQVGL